MKKSNTKMLLPIVGGVLLIAAGVVFLLNNLGVFQIRWEILIGPLFALGGLVFLLVFMINNSDWWALIPGFVLIGIGTIIFMGQNFSPTLDRVGGAVFLAFLGLPFLLIFITHPEHWWGLIPGGVLLTFAAVNLVSIKSMWSGAIFFFGLAITFGLVYILPKPAGRLKWALYPAGILFVVGILELFGIANVMRYVLPLALLVGGGYVLYRALRR
ncbi:MAG: hypothetical protein V2J07_11895 [Anaerolineae bacterium]|jgi:hypothetical protein|nr:hypothetical protein [Anaerolineae bacterium]